MNVSVHVEQPHCYWIGNAEIRFQTFHFEINILMRQKIRNAYYNVFILNGEEKVRVHLCKRGTLVLEAERLIHATLQVM
jgi:hypothetical protein